MAERSEHDPGNPPRQKGHTRCSTPSVRQLASGPGYRFAAAPSRHRWTFSRPDTADVETAHGAEVAGVERGPKGAKRLDIRTPGGLITIEVP